VAPVKEEQKAAEDLIETSSEIEFNDKRLKISRHFTKQGTNPLDELEYEKRSSVIAEPDGTVVFKLEGVEVPKNWTQLATDIMVSKYFRKAGVPGTGNEVSAKQVIHRVANTIRMAGEALGYFQAAEDSDAFEAELAYILINQKGAFNSPVWFNCGLYHQYGISGTGGNWYWDFDTQSLQQTTGAYARPQCSACFIQSIKDDLMSIFDLIKSEARLFKYGSGSGTNFSTLRSRYEKLAGGGTSSGLMTFLKIFDRAAGSMKSGGTTRRAAKMVCLDLDHPEIIDFINWKVEEEKKVKALVAAGYPSDFNGEAYLTVSGQNSNNSVRVPDEFMQAYLTGAKWKTRFRTTGEVHKEYEARDMMRQIAQAAWVCADPGVQFDTVINDWHTCPNSDRIHASNPCSEFMFLDDSSCNLSSINLMKFLNEDGTFDIEAYRRACRVLLIAQEILVDFASYPTMEIAKNTHDYRALGLGYANLGTLLMVMGVPYDSDKGRAISGAITAIMTGQAYCVSAEMSAVKGPFAGFKNNREPMLRVMRKHRDAAYKIDVRHCPPELLKAARDDWDNAVELGEKYGFRNSQVTVLAPTGTIGLLMDCDTTGVEPDFSLVKYKKLAGGGYFKIINQSVPRALRKLSYTADEVKEIQAYVLEGGTMEGAPYIKDDHLAVFDCANRCGTGKRFIDPMGHIKMMASVQPFLSGSLSKTVNLPTETTVEEIEKIYIDSWKMGLKAVAVYRDGCKLSQPLTAGTKMADENKGQKAEVETKVLQSKRAGRVVDTVVGGHRIVIRTGEFSDGSLGEVSIDMHKEGATMRSLMNCIAQAVSIGLQHGVPLEQFVDAFTFTRFEPAGMTTHPNIKTSTSMVDFVFRVLGFEYLGRNDLVHVKPVDMPKDDQKQQKQELSSAKLPAPASLNSPPKKAKSALDLQLSNMMGDAPPCPSCGNITIRSGTCYKCLNCGSTTGCS
jgi:ribonucleoside-diphosphate reductase alpha chain